MFNFIFTAVRACFAAIIFIVCSVFVAAFLIAFIPIFIIAALGAYIFDMPITITRNKKQVGIYQRSTGYRKTYSN